MKKMKITTMVLGVLITSGMTGVYGNMPYPTERPSKVTMVTFNDVEIGDILYIKDREGLILYTERIKTEGSYINRFDLSNLPADRYFFEVDKDHEITILPFSIGMEKVMLNQELRTEIAKPKLVPFKDNMYRVFFTRESEEEKPLQIEIYYEGLDLVYTNAIENVGKTVQTYDFTESAKGEYLFYIKYKDRTFSEYVDVL